MKTKANKTSSSKKEWNDMTAKEKRDVYIIVITLAVFLVFWFSFGFRSAIGMVLLGYTFYFIYKIIRESGARKKNFIIAIVLFFAAGVILPPTENTETAANSAEQTKTQSQAEIDQLTEQKKLEEAQKIKQEQEKKKELESKVKSAQLITSDGNLYRVTSITDGDTIKIEVNGRNETVRFIGMDTPETKDPRKPVQCFGKEATSKMQSYVQSKTVRIVKDDTQGDRDKYGRLLRHVFLEDGRNVAYEMIRGGYAHEYTYNLPYKYQSQFKAAEKAARESSDGLWLSSTCNGKTDQELPKVEAKAPSPVPKYTPVPTPAPKPSYTPAPKPTPQPSTYYANCSAARAAGAAPVYAGQPGYGTHLDRDRDGIGCE